MDNLNNRDGEEDIFAMMRDDAGGSDDSLSEAEDGSQFLNDSGPGMEIEQTGTDRTTTDLTGPKQSGEVC